MSTIVEDQVCGAPPGPDPAAQALNDLHQAIDSLSHVDLSALPADERMDAMRFLDSARTRLEGEISLELAALAEHETRRELGVTSVSAWLCAATGTSRGDANRRVALANTLDELPLVRAAVLEGEISLGAVRVIERARNPRTRDLFDIFTEAFFVDIAKARSCAGLAAEVDAWLDRHDTDGPAPDDPTTDRLHADRVGDRVLMRGDLCLGTGLPMLAALEEEMARLAAAANNNNNNHNHNDGDSETSWRCPANRRAEALSSLLAAGAAAPGSAYRREPSVITVERPGPDGTVRVETPGGSIIPRRLVDSWGLDRPERRIKLRFAEPETGQTARFLDADGNVVAELDLGRTTRFANRAQRRALAARDGGCAFPGCGRPHQLAQAHHIIWWERGGLTDLDNLVLLCPFHHVLIHTGLFSVETIDHQPVFRRTPPEPEGEIIEHDWHRHPPPRC